MSEGEKLVTYMSVKGPVQLWEQEVNDIPFEIRTNAKRYTWPLKNMEPGESLFINCTSPNPSTLGLSAFSAAKRVAKKNLWFFAAKKVEGGVRIWRLY